MTITGKNGSSSGYNAYLHTVQLHRVSALNLTAPMRDRIISLSYFNASGNDKWSAITVDAIYSLGGYVLSTSTYPSAIWHVLDLAAGTWDYELMYSKGPNRGIIHVLLDGAEVGTIDGYAAGVTQVVRTALTGIRVPTSGNHELRLVTLTKNASSSDYYGIVSAMQMRRTA